MRPSISIIVVALLALAFLFAADVIIFAFLGVFDPSQAGLFNKFLPYLIAINLAVAAVAVAAARALQKRPVTGSEGLVGQEGVAITRIAPDGRAFLQGEIWNVTADEEIDSGQKLVVTEVAGLRLKVKAKSSTTPPHGKSSG